MSMTMTKRRVDGDTDDSGLSVSVQSIKPSPRNDDWFDRPYHLSPPPQPSLIKQPRVQTEFNPLEEGIDEEHVKPSVMDSPDKETGKPIDPRELNLIGEIELMRRSLKTQAMRHPLHAQTADASRAAFAHTLGVPNGNEHGNKNEQLPAPSKSGKLSAEERRRKREEFLDRVPQKEIPPPNLDALEPEQRKQAMLLQSYESLLGALRKEEARLAQIRLEEEQERQRPAADKWYTLKSARFGYELKKVKKT
jgi:hypothetical protein